MMMRTTVTGLLFSLSLTPSVIAQNSPMSVLVTARMDPYKAGGFNDGSDGVPPASFTFPASTHQYIGFPSITGLWSCGQGEPLYGPDGTHMTSQCDGPFYIRGPIGPFSGFVGTDFYGALVGVFLEDALRAVAPPSRRFYVSNSSQGGTQTDFTVLFPQIGEVFFIGDGLTGTGTGTVQKFRVPDTATHLYFGYLDGFSGVPGGYSNNPGLLRVVGVLAEQ